MDIFEYNFSPQKKAGFTLVEKFCLLFVRKHIFQSMEDGTGIVYKKMWGRFYILMEFYPWQKGWSERHILFSTQSDKPTPV